MNGYTQTDLNPPAADEVEFSLFGPGFGECVVCHIGSAQWVIVDSCLDPATKEPVALKYLESLGVAVDSAIAAIVSTHWHDDHIKGLSRILEAAPAARYAVTSAFDKADFRAALSQWMDGSSDLEGKGFSELRRIMSLKRHPILAGENKIIFERSAPPKCQVLALSPSDAAVIACISKLADIPKTKFRRRMPEMKGNHASVVLSIEVENRRLLLGGDLQVREDRKFGWLAVVDTHKEFGRSKHHVFKVPHHGSANADDPEIWTHLLELEPHAVLAPFIRGKEKLPTAEDTARIKQSAGRAFITARPTTEKFHHPKPSVEKTMREGTRSLEVIPHRFGHVRLRGRLSEDPQAWRVEHFGDAQQL